MNGSAYALLSAAARYWFLALALFILVRLVLAVTREMRIERRVQQEIGQAGTNIGATLELLSDEERHYRRGRLCPVEGETTFGSSGKCDVRLRSLCRVHCILRRSREGMMVLPVGRALVLVDDEEVLRRAIASDGAVIQMGGLRFRLHMEGTDEA